MTSRYKPYLQYKSLGDKWFQSIPLEWTLLRLKFCAKINMGQSPNSDDCNFEGIGLPFLQGNAEFGSRYPKEKQYCPEAKKIAKVGNLLLSVRAPVGALNIADKNYGIGRGLCSIQNYSTLIKDYLWWALFSHKSQLDAVASGSTFESVSSEQVGNLFLSIPPHLEQQKIADFLDHETSKIDTLIAKQERLIELLKEKRQAVISHAVTKGLNPNVKMKDSGVEWLGEVPEHWRVIKLKFVCNITTGSRDTQDATKDGKYPFFVRSDNIQAIDTYSFDGEGVMTSGDGAGVGKIFHHFIGKCEIHQRVYLFYKFRNVLARYFYHFIKQNLEPIAISQSAKSTVESLRLPILQEFQLCFGEEKEQQKICEYIDALENKYISLIDRCTNKILLLQERKTALISAVVTGKIDVCDWGSIEEDIHDE